MATHGQIQGKYAGLELWTQLYAYITSGLALGHQDYLQKYSLNKHNY